MKYMVAILLIFISARSYSCDDLNTYLKQILQETSKNSSFTDLSTILKKSFEIDSSKVESDYIVVVNAGEYQEVITLQKEELRILGITEQEALMRSGDEFGVNSCSDKHLQGDMANRWCHGSIVKLADSALRDNTNINKYITNLLAASIFLPKEFLMDTNPSAGDLVLTDIPIYDNANGDKIELTVFGDGLFYVHFTKKF